MTTSEDISARPAQSDFLVMDSGPERIFRVGVPSTTETGPGAGTVTAAMLTGPWLAGPAGIPPGGTLGVLIDGVTAHAALLGRPPAAWSVSAEISLDLCGPVPADGSVLTATARVAGTTGSGALGTGTVTDASGQLLALCQQHTRWIPAPEQTPWETPEEVAPRPVTALDAGSAADLVALIGARVQAADGGAVAEVPVTSDLANPLGNMHGGVIFTVVDLTAQAALASVGAPVQTASVRVAYPRPVPLNAAARFEARVIHRGRSFGVVEVSSRNEAGKPCVIATVTTSAVPGGQPPGPPGASPMAKRAILSGARSAVPAQPGRAGYGIP